MSGSIGVGDTLELPELKQQRKVKSMQVSGGGGRWAGRLTLGGLGASRCGWAIAGQWAG